MRKRSVGEVGSDFETLATRTAWYSTFESGMAIEICPAPSLIYIHSADFRVRRALGFALSPDKDVEAGYTRMTIIDR